MLNTAPVVRGVLRIFVITEGNGGGRVVVG